jgi:hypothetical protein
VTFLGGRGDSVTKQAFEGLAAQAVVEELDHGAFGGLAGEAVFVANVPVEGVWPEHVYPEAVAAVGRGVFVEEIGRDGFAGAGALLEDGHEAVAGEHLHPEAFEILFWWRLFNHGFHGLALIF